MEIFERLHHRGRQIGATAHRLAQQHVGPLALGEAFQGSNHVGEAAAEAAAGHLLDARAGGLEDFAIDQLGCLIIGYQADAFAQLR